MTTYERPTTRWFNAITAHLHAEPNRRGDVSIICPNCGANKKFAFSVKGANCFLCGWQPKLEELAEKLGVQGNIAYVAPQPTTRTKAYRPHAWQDKAEQIAVDQAASPGAFQAWTAYKPISADTFKRYQLGYGVFPGGLWDGGREAWCHHPRLIVPLFEGITNGRRIVGFRCRATTCSCTKWLSPGGSRMVLYGIEGVQPNADVVVIGENPIDKLLIKQAWEGDGVATMGVNIWKDDYTRMLIAKRPKQVLIWMDNDVSGQTTNPKIISDWKERRRARGLPDDETKFLAGIKLTNRLLEAGLNATFYRWPNDAREKADIGDFFKK